MDTIYSFRVVSTKAGQDQTGASIPVTSQRTDADRWRESSVGRTPAGRPGSPPSKSDRTGEPYSAPVGRPGSIQVRGRGAPTAPWSGSGPVGCTSSRVLSKLRRARSRRFGRGETLVRAARRRGADQRHGPASSLPASVVQTDRDRCHVRAVGVDPRRRTHHAAGSREALPVDGDELARGAVVLVGRGGVVPHDQADVVAVAIEARLVGLV